MRIDESIGGTGDDVAARRERVVQAVTNRIHAAPSARNPRGMLVDLATFSIPAIAAAALVMVASAAFIATHDQPTREPATIAEGLGVPPMLLGTGDDSKSLKEKNQ